MSRPPPLSQAAMTPAEDVHADVVIETIYLGSSDFNPDTAEVGYFCFCGSKNA